ncbi:hypothetical protein DAI22_04g216650 [Oryza sativa Japonica Group]|nr:hypothetical protein DAI22_04g216650 [Oryza sativa Japonica Group]
MRFGETDGMEGWTGRALGPCRHHSSVLSTTMAWSEQIPLASNGTVPSFPYLSTVLVETFSLSLCHSSFLICCVREILRKGRKSSTPSLGVTESIPHYVVYLLFVRY